MTNWAIRDVRTVCLCSHDYNDDIQCCSKLMETASPRQPVCQSSLQQIFLALLALKLHCLMLTLTDRCSHSIIINESYIKCNRSLILPFYCFPQSRLFLINSRLTKIELFPILVLLNEEDKVCGLKRSQDFSDAIDHVLKLDALLLDIVLDFLQITYQLLQQLLLLLQELPFALDLAFLLLTKVQRIS